MSLLALEQESIFGTYGWGLGMGKSDKQCPKCASKMKAGFLSGFPDSSHRLTAWCDGSPKKSRGFALDGVRIDPKECFRLEPYRCPECGYIELYALVVDSFASAGKATTRENQS